MLIIMHALNVITSRVLLVLHRDLLSFLWLDISLGLNVNTSLLIAWLSSDGECMRDDHLVCVFSYIFDLLPFLLPDPFLYIPVRELWSNQIVKRKKG